jgi:hypothetical protein
MRTLGFLLSLRVVAATALLAGCATVERPKPLAAADIVAMAKAGRSAQQIIEELKRTDTVLPLQASDIVALHEAGVPDEVLDWMQAAQIQEIRWRDRNSAYYWYGPMNRGFGPCPWPYGGFRRPYLGGPWGC